MIARLRLPFNSLSSEAFISRGSSGQVFAVSRRIVLKCPTLFDDPAPPQEVEMQESIKRIENEKKVYGVLLNNRHPHILYSVRCIPQGILLHRQAMTLEERIAESPNNPIPCQVQERWVRQLVSASAWLEQLGLIHGDLRPANIFLTAMGSEGNVQLGDFDSTVVNGAQLVVASEPFCKLQENYELPAGSPVTEQFSLGSCIYTIRFLQIPWHDIDAPTRVCKLMRNEFPETSSDDLFGEITAQCWHGMFESVRAVEEEIVSQLRLKRGEDLVGKLLGSVDYDLASTLDAECDDFLNRDCGRTKNPLA